MQIFIDNFIETNFKSDLKTIFRKKRELKDGSEGSTYLFPTIVTLHTNPSLIEKWIDYSTLDTEVTFFLKETLQILL